MNSGGIEIISRCDLYELHEAVKAVGIDLVMTNSHWKCISTLETQKKNSHEHSITRQIPKY